MTTRPVSGPEREERDVGCVQLPHRMMAALGKPMAALDTANLSFTQITTNAKGAKTLPALCKNGTVITWQFSDPMEVPFDASAYNDPDGTANRVTLCVTPSAHMCATIAALDDWCIQALSENPTVLLGMQLSPEQVKERYVSCLKTSEKGYTS